MNKFLLVNLLCALFSAQLFGQQTDDDALGEPPVSALLVCDTAAVAPEDWLLSKQTGLDSLLRDPLLQTSQLGLMVYDLTADTIVYAHGARQTMRPASTMKLITAITALDLLGTDYRFATSLYLRGGVSGGCLRGRLRVRGGMDPLFDDDDMAALAQSLRSLGADTVCCEVVFDDAMKDTTRLGEGWCWDDSNPVLTPLLVNGRDAFAGHFFSSLSREGLVLKSDLSAVDSTANDEWRRQPEQMLCRRTHSIDQVLYPMMKDSKNLFAESLFFQVAAYGTGHRATSKDGTRAMRRLVNALGLRPENYRFADGSGLSLYNYVSPELMVRLLAYAWRSPDVRSHLLFSLPIAGEDGTLKKRMHDVYEGRGRRRHLAFRSHAQGNVRAKTGTLTGIISLAGYLTASNGHDLCFCIINQGVLSASQARAFQDQICEFLSR